MLIFELNLNQKGRKGTVGIICLLVTCTLVLADSSTDEIELEYFKTETECEPSQNYLTEEYKAELKYCIRANNETVYIAGNQMIYFD